MSRTTATSPVIPQRRTRQPAADPPPTKQVYFVAGSKPPELGKDLDYDRDLEIDPEALDAEWLDHARIAMGYVEAAADANREVMMAEERVKTKRAELVKETMGTDYGKNAATQEAYYRTDPEYQRLKQEWIDATHTAELLKGAASQMTSRKNALEKAVQLTGMGYNAIPSEPRNLPEAVARLREQRDASTQSAIRSRLNRQR